MNIPKTMLASDNASGIHDAVWRRLRWANRGHALGYGADPWTQEAEQDFRRHFGEASRVFMVCTGTAANVLALQAMAQSIDSVFCADCAHLLVDECGAPERMIGSKIVGVRSQDGKIDLCALEEAVAYQAGMVHRNRPRVVSLSQATERGTVYRPDEVHRIVEFARRNGMKVHMDGARLANAAVSLNLTLDEMTRRMGIDAVSFGGTKNGLMMAEAVVVLDPSLAEALPSIRKQGMQLASKQRFVAAQYLAYFEDELWRRNAEHANAMAKRLAQRLARVEGVQLAAPVEVNMVFARLPAAWIAPLQQHTTFHVWDKATSEVRLVTSYDTTEQDIDEFAAEITRLAAKEDLS